MPLLVVRCSESKRLEIIQRAAASANAAKRGTSSPHFHRVPFRAFIASQEVLVRVRNRCRAMRHTIPEAECSAACVWVQPVNTRFFSAACTPQLPSTTCVTAKSTATDMSEIASSSDSFCVDIRKSRIFR